MCSDVNRVRSTASALQRPKQRIDLGFLCVPVRDEANDGAVVIVWTPRIEEEIFFQFRNFVIVHDDKDLIGLMRDPKLISGVGDAFG